MNQCVPSWEVEEHPALPVTTSAAHSNSNSLIPDVPTYRPNYEVAELTWKNGQLAMHGFGIPRLPCNKNMENINSSAAECSWEKPLTGDTLESIVNQATKSAVDSGNKLMPWFDNRRHAPVVSCAPMTPAAAMTPCKNSRTNLGISTSVLEPLPGIGTRLVGCSTRVESCSVGPTLEDGRMARLTHEWSSRIEQSMSGSDTRGLDSRQSTPDTFEKEIRTAGFTSTSLGSPGNTTSGKVCTKTVDDPDSLCQSRNQREEGEEEYKKKVTGKSLVSAKKGRCAAIHNQSERKRREKINQRMKTLQKLVPNSNKTDKASMLDEVIDYLKQLQAQVHMINRMNMSSVMLPLALQQQLQMSMMAPMGMNMGMGLGVMDMNSIPRPNISAMPLHALHPNHFMPMPSWGIPPDRLAPSTSNPTADPLSATLLACQTQPMTMDAYLRMASLYQQFQFSSAPASKS